MVFKGWFFCRLDIVNDVLKYQLELKDDEISNLKCKLSTKDKIINKLQAEKEKINVKFKCRG